MTQTRILVVDDDLIFLDELSQGLGSLGHDVTVATSGAEAFDLWREQEFDLAICDMIMAGGGAVSFLHDVRAEDREFPVIVITGRREIASSPLFTQGMREASAKMEKGASLSEIDKTVRRLLR